MYGYESGNSRQTTDSFVDPIAEEGDFVEEESYAVLESFSGLVKGCDSYEGIWEMRKVT